MADRPAGVASRSSSKNATANPWPLPAWLLFWAETPGAFMTINATNTRSLFIRGAYGGVINWPSRFGVPPNFPFSRRTTHVRTSRVHVEVKTIVDDPQYLAQPFITSTHFKKWLESHPCSPR